jgi:hypothetical protein
MENFNFTEARVEVISIADNCHKNMKVRKKNVAKIQNVYLGLFFQGLATN